MNQMMIRHYEKICFVLFVIVLTVGLLPRAASAQDRQWCGSSAYIAVPCLFGEDEGLAGADSFGELVIAVINILLIVVASISVLFIIIGGFRYVLAHGNEEQAEGAKKTIIHAIVGLVIVIMSFAIIQIIGNILTAGQL